MMNEQGTLDWLNDRYAQKWSFTSVPQGGDPEHSNGIIIFFSLWGGMTGVSLIFMSMLELSLFDNPVVVMILALLSMFLGVKLSSKANWLYYQSYVLILFGYFSFFYSCNLTHIHNSHIALLGVVVSLILIWWGRGIILQSLIAMILFLSFGAFWVVLFDEYITVVLYLLLGLMMFLMHVIIWNESKLLTHRIKWIRQGHLAIYNGIRVCTPVILIGLLMLTNKDNQGQVIWYDYKAGAILLIGVFSFLYYQSQVLKTIDVFWGVVLAVVFLILVPLPIAGCFLFLALVGYSRPSYFQLYFGVLGFLVSVGLYYFTMEISLLHKSFIFIWLGSFMLLGIYFSKTKYLHKIMYVSQNINTDDTQ